LLYKFHQHRYSPYMDWLLQWVYSVKTRRGSDAYR
jgi:hypothetical protein